jgi:hypothetical protein
MASLPEVNGRKWYSYDEISGDISMKGNQLLVVQYESLGRICDLSDRNLGKIVFVLDEVNSIVHQMHGSFGDPMSAHRKFMQLCRQSRLVIAMDGGLDQERLDILDRYTRSTAYLINNTYQSRANQTFKITC